MMNTRLLLLPNMVFVNITAFLVCAIVQVVSRLIQLALQCLTWSAWILVWFVLSFILYSLQVLWLSYLFLPFMQSFIYKFTPADVCVLGTSLVMTSLQDEDDDSLSDVITPQQLPLTAYMLLQICLQDSRSAFNSIRKVDELCSTAVSGLCK